MTTITSNSTHPWRRKEGWYCPGCDKFHNPDVMSCPESPYEHKRKWSTSPPPWSISPPPPPWVSPTPVPTDIPLDPVCPKCGIVFSNTMCYYCHDSACPSGLGPATAYNEED